MFRQDFQRGVTHHAPKTLPFPILLLPQLPRTPIAQFWGSQRVAFAMKANTQLPQLAPVTHRPAALPLNGKTR
jgi:hypothetical protein